LSVYIQNNHRFNPLEVLEQMQERKVEPNRVSFHLMSEFHSQNF